MDIVEKFSLPSRGLVYNQEIAWKNEIRAPRLCDRGLGNLTKKNKLQASILDKTIVNPLGISAYDLHTADFLYLNFKQRQLTKNNKPYKIKIRCNQCDASHNLDFDLSEIKIKELKEKPINQVTISDNVVISLGYLTPRIFDDIKEKADQFREDFPEADQDLQLQEMLRSVIETIDGKKITYSQMTNFINNLYLHDVDLLLNFVSKIDFGIDLSQSAECSECGKKMTFTLPV